MKLSMFFIATLSGLSFAHAQNENNKPNTVLFIIKSEKNNIRTNHLFINANEVAHIDLPSKAEASKSLGSIKEDVVTYITLKKGVELLTLSKLLAKNNLDIEYKNIPVYIDGEEIPNPDDILSTETGLKKINRTSERIDITSISGYRPKNIAGTRQ